MGLAPAFWRKRQRSSARRLAQTSSKANTQKGKEVTFFVGAEAVLGRSVSSNKHFLDGQKLDQEITFSASGPIFSVIVSMSFGENGGSSGLAG